MQTDNDHKSKKIAIIGAGISGARLAYLLAKDGFKIQLFDPKAPWEKPCGGGLTAKIFEDFPEIGSLSFTRRKNNNIELITPFGRRSGMRMDSPIITVSRKEFGAVLLDQAIKAGAEFIPERVLTFENTGDKVPPDSPRAENSKIIINTKNGKYKSDIIVGADGVGSLVRKRYSTPIDGDNRFLSYGYLIPEEIDAPIVIKFYKKLKGYAWIFPRKNDTSAGIAFIGQTRREICLKKLQEFIDEEWKRLGLPLPSHGKPYAKHIPAMSRETFDRTDVCGKNWALVGDASGSADPLTGEGIYYALHTAGLLARAISSGDITSYSKEWHNMVFVSIRKVAKVINAFYSRRWLWVVGLMMDHSISLRKAACDIMTGAQGYETLKPRLKREATRYIKEALLSLFRISPAQKTKGL